MNLFSELQDVVLVMEKKIATCSTLVEITWGHDNRRIQLR